jgi:lipoprotein
MKKIFVILMLAFLLVSCNQIKKEVKNKPKEQENIKKEDILNTEVNEEINPNLDSEITTE